MSNIKTQISQACWCDSNGKFSPAKFLEEDLSKREICWFDELFSEELYIPEEDGKTGKPLFFLLSGPPGSGKTTLALEMCYRYTDSSSFYISAESEAWKLRKKAISYGWKNAEHIFECINNQSWSRINEQRDSQHVFIWGVRDKLTRKRIKGIKKIRNIDARILITTCIKIASLLTPLLGASVNFISKIADIILGLFIKKSTQNTDPKLGFLVIDSLNVVPQNSRQKLFDKFQKEINYGPKAVIFILDSGSSPQEHKYWEHICDVVLRVDYQCKDISDYLVRTIEVIKARYQPHVWGKHQLKIYGKSNISENCIENYIKLYNNDNDIKNRIKQKQKSHDPDWAENFIYDEIRTSHPDLFKKHLEKKRRAHPYCKEGGIFIFPSIHWFLSKYKRRSPVNISGRMPTHLKRLNILLGKDDISGGIPRGRCTALVGSRGTHKSHLGYYHILDNLYKSRKEEIKCENRESGLIISLRDDEGMAKEVMITILEEIIKQDDIHANRDIANNELNKYIDEGYLEILYFPPGYITPEEFYHRVLMSILRLKNRYSTKEVKVTALFNSLDQLFARFPLCAKEDVFIPGLIDTFTAEGVNSIFITVDEQGQPAHQYGLLSMADLIISAKQRIFNNIDFFGHLEDSWHLEHPLPEEIKESFGEDIQSVVLWVERYAGGQRAGQGGILELMHNIDYKNLYETIMKLSDKEKTREFIDDLKTGLIFTPFSAKHSLGEPIIDPVE